MKTNQEKLLYDNFEVSKAGEYTAEDGTKYCCPILDQTDTDDLVCEFWTVYGHYPEGGVEAIGDFQTEEAAFEVYNFFQMLLKNYKQHNK